MQTPKFLGVKRAGIIPLGRKHQQCLELWGDDGRKCWRVFIPGTPRSFLCVQFARREDAVRGALALEELNLDWQLPHDVLRRQLEGMGGMDFVKRTIAEAMAW